MEHAFLIGCFEQKLWNVISRETKHVLALQVIVRYIDQRILHRYRMLVNKNVLEKQYQDGKFSIKVIFWPPQKSHSFSPCSPIWLPRAVYSQFLTSKEVKIWWPTEVVVTAIAFQLVSVTFWLNKSRSQSLPSFETVLHFGYLKQVGYSPQFPMGATVLLPNSVQFTLLTFQMLSHLGYQIQVIVTPMVFQTVSQLDSLKHQFGYLDQVTFTLLVFLRLSQEAFCIITSKLYIGKEQKFLAKPQYLNSDALTWVALSGWR